MTKDVALFEGQTLPAHMKSGDVSDATKALMGSGGGNTKRVSIRGSVFRMMVGAQEIAKNDNRAINMVIVAAAPAYARTYYEGTFDPDNASPPACWSDDGQAPSGHAIKPQAATCNACPQNVRGSGQGDSRACRTSARIAVVMDGDVGGDVFSMTIPAMSIFGEAESTAHYSLQNYVRKLAAHGFDISKVVTEFKFDTSASTPKLMFRAVRPVTDEEWVTIQSLTADTEALQHIEPRIYSTGSQSAGGNTASADLVDDKPLFGDAPAEKEKPAAEKPAPEVDEEEVAEPKKRSKTNKAPDAVDEDLASLVDEWADD